MQWSEKEANVLDFQGSVASSAQVQHQKFATEEFRTETERELPDVV